MIQRVKPFLPYLYLLGLLLWGGYVTLYFLGYDSHIVVLLRANEWKVIAQGATSPFLRGLSSVIPFLSYLLERLRPFTSYAVISALLYLAYVAYTILKRGRLFIETRLSALHIILLAVGSLWLLTTTLFYAPIPGLQPRLLIEPSKEVYDNIGEEGVTALVENFQSLSDRGCLVADPTRTAKSGARVFTYRGWCMQKAFFRIILSQLGMLFFLVLDFLVLGRFLLWLIRVRPTDRFMAFLMSLGLGAAALTFFAMGPCALWRSANALCMDSLAPRSSHWLSAYMVLASFCVQREMGISVGVSFVGDPPLLVACELPRL